VIRRGDVALCASCDARRSTLGKGQPATRLPAAPPADLLHWVTQDQRRLRNAEAELAATAPGPPARPHLDSHRSLPRHHHAGRATTLPDPLNATPAGWGQFRVQQPAMATSGWGQIRSERWGQFRLTQPAPARLARG
jgi:hypothetical protein